jgi:predicted nucleic acid-binding protein
MTIRVYFDTWYLAGLVASKSTERSDMKHMLSQMKHGFEVVIPHVALGEVFAIILKKNKKRADAEKRLIELCDDLNSVMNVESCMPPPSIEVFEYVEKIRNVDSEIKDMDLLITAHAMADPYSTRLLTGDKILLNSNALRTMESELRENNTRKVELRITDGISH